MWSTIMEQNLLTRKARAAELTARQRRQCKLISWFLIKIKMKIKMRILISKLVPRRINVLVDLKVCEASQENQVR